MQDDHEHDSAGIMHLENVISMAQSECRQVQGVLQESTRQFAAASSEVMASVGGSAQNVDKELVEALARAGNLTNRALNALGSVR